MNFETVIKEIKKRDGKIAPFDITRISEAIHKAMRAVGEKDDGISEKIAEKVVRKLEEDFNEQNIPGVEDIQDRVESCLMKEGLEKVAKAYILYREKRSEVRSIERAFDEMFGLVDEYIEQSDWRVNENSNMSYSLQGLNNHISASISSRYWLEKIYPKEIGEKHRNGDLHIHDLGMLSVYCCGWDLEDLLRKGLGGVTGKVESAPPKHFRTALGQIVNFFYTLQGEAAGAQAFANFDTYLAPFVAYDKLEYKEVKQAIQEFVFNVNVPTRVGFQTPFTNVTMDLQCPSSMKDQPVIIGGKEQAQTYGEFQKEMDMVNSAFAEVMMEGDAKGRIFTFPIPTYNITKDFDWDNEGINKLWEMTAKYGIPYFSNFVNSDMDPDDARSMCCRLRLDNRALKKRAMQLTFSQTGLEEEQKEKDDRPKFRGGGLFGANPLTGSIGVVTINLPRIAYLAKDVNDFKKRLRELMDIAKDSLEIKRKVLEQFTEQGLYPYSRVYLAGIKETVGTYWGNHFSTIGLIGMNEACINLLGKDITTKEGFEFAKEALAYMRDILEEYQDETGYLFNLEATPAEGTSYRLAKIDKKMYPDIVAQGKETPYYTNSTQLPVNFTSDIFEALELQDDLQSLYTGGTVLHIFTGEYIDDISVVKTLVRKISHSYKLPYFTITPTFSICPVHGYIPGEYEYCPYEHTEEELEKYGVIIEE